MRTLIHTWTQQCCNTKDFPATAYWGLGDTIRNTLFLYQYCKRKGYRLIVDFSLHPIAGIWQNKSHEFQELVQSKKDQIPFVTRGTLDLFLKENTEDVLVLFPVGWPRERLTADEKEFIKNLMHPHPALEAKWLSFIQQQGFTEDYTVVHFRFLDAALNNGLNDLPFSKARQVFLKWKNNSDVLLSDSPVFKQRMHAEFGIKTFDLKVTRFGKTDDSAALEDTVFEFYFLRKAARILTYSEYPWVSSFVYWSHKIYGTPLKVIGENGLKARFTRWGFRQMVVLLKFKDRWF